MTNTKRQWEVFSAVGNTIALMEQDPIFEAETGRKALDMYLKASGLSYKVKVSASNDVHFKVTPILFIDGRKWIDGRKRAMWYQITN